MDHLPQGLMTDRFSKLHSPDLRLDQIVGEKARWVIKMSVHLF